MPCLDCGNEETPRVAGGGDPYFSIRFLKQVMHAHEVNGFDGVREEVIVYEPGSRHYLPIGFLAKLPREAFEFRPRSQVDYFESIIDNYVEEVVDEVEGSEVVESPVPSIEEYEE